MKTVTGMMLALGLAAGTAFGAAPNKTVMIKPSGPSENASKVKTPDEPSPVTVAPEAPAAAAEAALEPGAVPAGYEALAKRLGLSKFLLYRVQGKRIGVTGENGYLLLTDDYAKVDGQKGPTSLAVLLDAEGAVKRVVLLRTPDDAACVRLVVPQLGVLEKQTVLTGEEARPVLAIPGAVETSAGMQKTVNGTLELFKPLFRRLEQKDGGLNLDGNPLLPEGAPAPAATPAGDAPAPAAPASAETPAAA